MVLEFRWGEAERTHREVETREGKRWATLITDDIFNASQQRNPEQIAERSR